MTNNRLLREIFDELIQFSIASRKYLVAEKKHQREIHPGDKQTQIILNAKANVYQDIISKCKSLKAFYLPPTEEKR